MKSTVKLFKFGLILTAVIVTFSQIPSSFAAEVQRQASVVESNGKVEILKANQTDWTSARKGQILKQNDSIRTQANANAVLSIETVEEPSLIKLDANTQIKLSDLALEDTTGVENTLLDMAIGDILINTEPKPGSQFQVKTPTSIVGARGTSFRVKEYQS